MIVTPGVDGGYCMVIVGYLVIICESRQVVSPEQIVAAGLWAQYHQTPLFHGSVDVVFETVFAECVTTLALIPAHLGFGRHACREQKNDNVQAYVTLHRNGMGK